MKTRISVIFASMLLLAAVAAGCAQSTAGAAKQDQSQTPSAPQAAAPSAPTAPAPAAVKPAENAPAAETTSAGATGITKIGDVVGNPQTYGGKVVTVQGKIVNECGSGCWFIVQDGNAALYVDLAPNNMVIPQKKGAVAKVTGQIVREGTDVYMVGNKVDF